MAPTTITVSYTNGVVSASPADLGVGPGAQVINWTAGTGVNSITSIGGLPNPPFTTPNPSGGWKSTDTNHTTVSTVYTYTVYIWDGTTIRSQDPQITNNPDIDE